MTKRYAKIICDPLYAKKVKMEAIYRGFPSTVEFTRYLGRKDEPLGSLIFSTDKRKKKKNDFII